MTHEATAFLEHTLGAERVVVLDGECVDHADYYEHVLRDLIRRVSGGGLSMTHFAGSEGAPRRLTLAIDEGEPHTFEAEGNTDWLDSAAVVGAVNLLLGKKGDSRQLVEYHGDEFGQESGWVLVEPAELCALLEFGLHENPTISLCFGPGQRLTPVSEDRGGDGPEPWEYALLAL